MMVGTHNKKSPPSRLESNGSDAPEPWSTDHEDHLQAILFRGPRYSIGRAALLIETGRQAGMQCGMQATAGHERVETSRLSRSVSGIASPRLASPSLILLRQGYPTAMAVHTQTSMCITAEQGYLSHNYCGAADSTRPHQPRHFRLRPPGLIPEEPADSF